MTAVAKDDIEATGPGALATGFRRLARNHLGMAGFVIVTVIVLSAIFADWIVPYDPVAMNLKDRMQGPSWATCSATRPPMTTREKLSRPS